MSKDGDFLLPFPTRHGTPTGHANERQMADKVDRSGIRTVIRKTSDGGEVMLRTRAGFNEYTTKEPEDKASVPELYLESGAQTLLNEPDGAAVWETLGLASESKDYMAGIWADGPMLGKHSSGAITDSNASKAMIEPERKPVAEQFPASLFSGTMRLFIQAMYGAKKRTELDVVTEDDYVCSFDVISGDYARGGYDAHIKSVYLRDGSNTPAPHRRLRYTDAENENQEVILGINVVESCGIFRSKRKYWVITLNRYSNTLTVIAYPLAFPAKTRAVLRRIDKVTAPAEQTAESRLEARRLMAYAFAYAKIDTAQSVVLSTTLACGEGETLCYGFKWNRDGTEAKLVSHVTEEVGYAARWHAYETTVTISYTDNPYITEEADKFTLESSVEDHDIWTNRKESLIYAPPSESVDRDADDKFRLHNINLGHGAGLSTGASCADVPIYGFYVDDEWVPVLFTNELRNADKEFWTEQTSVCSGYWTKDPDGTPPYSPSGFYEYNGSQFVVDATWRIPWGQWYQEGGGFSIAQRMEYIFGILLRFNLGENDVHTVIGDGTGKRREMTMSPGASSTPAPNVPWGNSYGSGNSGSYGEYWSPDINTIHGAGTGFFFDSAFAEFDAQCADEYANSTNPDYYLRDWFCAHDIEQVATPAGVYRTYSRPSGTYDKVALVIPHGDCEAVFLARGEDGWVLDYEGDMSTSIIPVVVTSTWNFWKVYHNNYTGLDEYVKVDGCPNPTDEFWATVLSPTMVAIGTTEPGATETMKLETPTVDKGMSTSVDFDDFWKPENLFFAAGMYALSAMGGKHVTSQGSTDSFLGYSDRFCGWA